MKTMKKLLKDPMTIVACILTLAVVLYRLN